MYINLLTRINPWGRLVKWWALAFEWSLIRLSPGTPSVRTFRKSFILGKINRGLDLGDNISESTYNMPNISSYIVC